MFLFWILRFLDFDQFSWSATMLQMTIFIYQIWVCQRSHDLHGPTSPAWTPLPLEPHKPVDRVQSRWLELQQGIHWRRLAGIDGPPSSAEPSIRWQEKATARSHQQRSQSWNPIQVNTNNPQGESGSQHQLSNSCGRESHLKPLKTSWKLMNKYRNCPHVRAPVYHYFTISKRMLW